MCNMALKLPLYFYLLLEEPLGRYFQIRSPCYQVVQCKKETLAQVLSCEFWENFKNTFFQRTPPASGCNFIKKETLAQGYSWESCENSKNTFSYRTPPVAASQSRSNTNVRILSLKNMFSLSFSSVNFI